MYSFKIYRSNKDPMGGQFIDTERYDFSNYIFERTITPKWNDLGFKWEKNGERRFFRKKLDGKFSLVDADFEWVNGVRLDAIERNQYRVLIISEKVGGLWEEQWRGFFSVIVGEWDLYRCNASFSDLVVWDEYTIYLENIEQEKNLMDLPPFPVTYTVPEYEYEETYRTLDIDNFDQYAPCDYDLDPISAEEYFIEDKYVLYTRRIQLGNINTPESQMIWMVEGAYRRNWVVQVNSPGIDWQDLGEYPVDSGNETHKWVRNYLGISSPNYIQTTSNVVIEQAQNTSVCEVINDGLDISATSEFDNFENERSRFFGSAANYILGYTGFPSTIKSNFLYSATNPITGDANELGNIFIIQASDLRETSDPATKAMYSFRDIEEWMIMLNVYWYIDDGYLRFEHRDFFDNGLSYEGASVQNVSIIDNADLVFSYNNKNLPRIVSLDMFYKSGDDFYGSPILYGGSMANWGSEAKSSISTQSMTTDLSGAVLNRNISDSGFVLVAAEESGGSFVVMDGVGALTGLTIPNAPLSVANIEDKYWRLGSPSEIGVLNNNRIEFDSVDRNFIQEDFQVRWCVDFSPYKLIKTSYGNGMVEEALLTLKDKQLTLTLSY